MWKSKQTVNNVTNSCRRRAVKVMVLPRWCAVAFVKTYRWTSWSVVVVAGGDGVIVRTKVGDNEDAEGGDAVTAVLSPAPSTTSVPAP